MLSDRYFFVTCNVGRSRRELDEANFEILARVIEARRREPTVSRAELDELIEQAVAAREAGR